MDQSKQRARNLLIRKDLQIQKVKLVLAKFEAFIKQNMGLGQEEVNKIGVLREEELLKLQELESEIESSEDIYQQPFSTAEYDNSNGVLQQMDRQLNKNRGSLVNVNGQSSEDNTAEQYLKNIEYIRNVFVKYLEYLAQNNTKEIRTIEHVLFTELRVTRD